FAGTGRLVSQNALEVINDDDTTQIEAETIIIATGARNRTFPGMEVDGRKVISSKEAMVLEEPPQKMVIIGAGAIGVEFAYFYNEFGSEVHLVEMLPQILPVEDEEVARELEKSFLKSGIKIHKNTRVEKIDSNGNGVQVHTETDGEELVIEADIALVAVGVTGNIEDIGLETLRINTDRGAILVNEFGQTSVQNIYAIGDVVGPPWLAHVASAQGRIAVEHAVGRDPKALDLSNIPGCTYCHPQVASLGLTEAKARAAGLDIKVGHFNFRAIGKALAIGESTGFAKLIFSAEYGEILGCHIIGPEATELIAELVIAKALEATWMDIANTVHAHPTLSEIMMEAAADAFGEAIHH
ncbi:MAG: FAD-dependent oxidoreductase, partial [Candidatus Marinimicrobia bacterium]|nr:FAD-dependent oxidoreductase [Candidatus Neomarinimicrobiota bacterium]